MSEYYLIIRKARVAFKMSRDQHVETCSQQQAASSRLKERFRVGNLAKINRKIEQIN